MEQQEGREIASLVFRSVMEAVRENQFNGIMYELRIEDDGRVTLNRNGQEIDYVVAETYYGRMRHIYKSESLAWHVTKETFSREEAELIVREMSMQITLTYACGCTRREVTLPLRALDMLYPHVMGDLGHYMTPQGVLCPYHLDLLAPIP